MARIFARARLARDGETAASLPLNISTLSATRWYGYVKFSRNYHTIAVSCVIALNEDTGNTAEEQDINYD